MKVKTKKYGVRNQQLVTGEYPLKKKYFGGIEGRNAKFSDVDQKMPP